jgi:hypothetical protein
MVASSPPLGRLSDRVARFLAFETSPVRIAPTDLEWDARPALAPSQQVRGNLHR